MKTMIRLLMFAAIVAAFAAPVLAQSKECNDDNKQAWYKTFLDNYKGSADQQKVAYDAAKNYLTACPADPSDQIAAYLKKFVDLVDKARGDIAVKNQLEEAYTKKNYAEAVRLGKQVLATDPEYLRADILIALSGFYASSNGDASLLGDASEYAKRTIDAINAGKPFAPYATKDQALASLNYVIAKAAAKNAPADAIPYFLKAARFVSDLNKSPQLYLDLAGAYEEGPRAKLSAEYKTKVGPNNTETPESKLVLENLNQVIDRQIDAWARAAALTTNAADKKQVMDALTELYKYRNKSETGLNELVASVLSKPLPDVPTPITSLPTPTPTPSGSQISAGTPGTNGGTGGSGGAKPVGNSSTNQQTKTTSTSATGTQTGSAKPTASPTPKPKPRRSNHRVGR